ncbi:16S rRNA (uracil(1498)-N(3))-methyltransferase [Thioalkalivibrio sp.]|uniref:16S rRNA (uracil(1498)-N(3))-methyltransferase n=1 Tax=Thioalkalivibrio sp. TaxID=2093813 RepID=UPI003569AE3D
MRVPRLLVESELATGRVVDLPAGTLRHAVSVLRLRDGAACRVFDGAGREHAAVLSVSGRRAGSVRIGQVAAAPTTPARPIRLLQGIARGGHMDLAIQKAVELGVAEIWPVLSARSRSGGGHRRVENRYRHWLGVLRAATEQCGRNELARLEPPRELPEALEALPTRGLRALADPAGDPPEVWRGVQTDSGNDPVAFLVGPEGGLGPEEIALARGAGFRGLRLGPRTLRTETASVAGLAVLQTLFGDLR